MFNVAAQFAARRLRMVLETIPRDFFFQDAAVFERATIAAVYGSVAFLLSLISVCLPYKLIFTACKLNK